MSDYYLAPQVHLCLAGKQVVFLDLEHDKYHAISQTHPAGRWVKGWPEPTSASSTVSENERSPGIESGLLVKMISQGLLVTDPGAGKEAVPVVTAKPKNALLEYDLNVRPHATLAQLWRMLTAYAAAQWAFKHRPIKEVIGGIAHLRTKRMPSASGEDIARARSLVTVFDHLRPLFYTAQDACLLDSLTLLHFLAGYRVFPQWIFAVKTNPFQAHCWVQQGDFVFNDHVDYVRGFSPILVV